MKNLLNNLVLSAKHLHILDKVLRENYPPYRDIAIKLERVPLFKEFCKEIYAGGKKGGKYGYNRQMILGDLIQYILTGRGYYFAVREKGKKEYLESFIRIIMYVCNLLILMEDLSVEIDLRNKVLDTLKNELGDKFFEDKEQEEAFKELRRFDGKILPGTRIGKAENFFDSILPKRVGCVPELLVYAYLIRKRYGYVIPLLTSQRLLGNNGDYIIPPDFLLLRSKGEIFGLEVGTGKERQIAGFSTVTSIPVFTAGIGSPERPQPYRCYKCGKWIAYCDKVIELCAKNEDEDQEYFDCGRCDIVDDYSECPFAVYYGDAHSYNGEVKKAHYHYKCVKDDPLVQKKLLKSREHKIVALIPRVYGLEYIREED